MVKHAAPEGVCGIHVMEKNVGEDSISKCGLGEGSQTPSDDDMILFMGRDQELCSSSFTTSLLHHNLEEIDYSADSFAYI